MKWIESLGGPLIMLEARLLNQWDGNLKQNQGNSDYEKALEVGDYLGVLDIPGGQVLVLGDEPMRTTIFESPDGTHIIVQWEYSDSEEMVSEQLKQIQSSDFEQASIISFNNGGSKILITDSVFSSNNVADHLEFELSPGVHKIETIRYQPEESTSLILHRIS